MPVEAFFGLPAARFRLKPDSSDSAVSFGLFAVCLSPLGLLVNELRAYMISGVVTSGEIFREFCCCGQYSMHFFNILWRKDAGRL